MRNIIDILEKHRILEMHNNEKTRLINEQLTNEFKEKLTVVKGIGCLQNVELVEFEKFTTPVYQWALEKTTKSGTTRYFFANGQTGFYQQGPEPKFIFDEKTWPIEECTPNFKQIELLRKNENWKFRTELSNVPAYQLNDREMYDINTDYGVTLYRSVPQRKQPAAYTKEQKIELQHHVDNGYWPKSCYHTYEWNMLDCETPDTKGEFPAGWEACRYKGQFRDKLPPKCTYESLGLEIKSTPQTTIGTVNPQKVEDNILKWEDSDYVEQFNFQNTPKDVCEKTINIFYQGFKTNRGFSGAALSNMKSFVQACVFQHEFRGTTKEQVKILTNKIPGKGPNFNSPFKLIPPND